ncbi:hypothetical protein M3484_04270 [Pseudomonas sp. GX19020]|uniref:hypothetical protein n=1 Tax=Pseudomonas sp. GX19020 TaxID=2942277 RepID=UPI00201A1D0B|nr:hypothetical protein [Pseudomonas sp. GX19020]MCL4065780.1 hypothetical protein [Pseudomonas sp. GX19020]
MGKTELTGPERNAPELTGAELDRVFLLARATAPEPSGALMAHVLQAGLAAMPAPSGAPSRVLRPAGAGFLAGIARLWSSFSAGFGGSGVVASLGAVAALALFLGYSDPAGLGDGFLTAAGAMTVTEGDDGPELEPVAIYFLAGG